MTTKQREYRIGVVTNPSLDATVTADTDDTGIAARIAAGEPIMYVEDAQERLGKKPDGDYRRSSWWVRMHVAPDKKFYLGGLACWFKSDFDAWLLEQFEQRKSA